MSINKEKLSLVYGHGAVGIYNTIPVSNRSLEDKKIDKEDIDYIYSLIKIYNRSKGHIVGDLIISKMNTVYPIYLDKYPLPALATKAGTPIVNLKALPNPNINDFSSADIFALYTYAIAFSRFTQKNISQDLIDPISRFFYAVFVRFFGKKSGLVGDHRDLLPKLHFLIKLYVSVSMFGLKQDDRLYRNISAKLVFNYEGTNLNFDFSDTIDFLKSIKANNIIPISENKFSSNIITRVGIASLPMFEDLPRLLATIIASSVAGNKIFSSNWLKVSKPLYLQLLNVAIKELR